MKFSYQLIKRFLPKIPPVGKLMEGLNMHSFEVEGVDGDTIEIKLPANRYSDASSHMGIAREAGVIFGTPLKNPIKTLINLPAGKGLLRVKIQASKLCSRYSARVFELPKKYTASPTWLRTSLKSCGVQSISFVVDLMNYAMLVTGQPLHAFDAEDIEGSIVVRLAKRKERITTLDDRHLELTDDVLLIADEKKPLAIAGIKGGKDAGVTGKTRRIIVEGANFDMTNILRSSRELKLQTDASMRFSHNLSPALVDLGLDLITAELKTAGAKLLDTAEVYPKKQGEETISYDISNYEKLIGAKIAPEIVKRIFSGLGFEIDGKKIHVPAWRNDIEGPEDLSEELARFVGYGKLQSRPPLIAARSIEEAEEYSLGEKVRRIMPHMGFDEVYNSSFWGERELASAKETLFGIHKPLELENPISEDKKILRMSLIELLLKNAEDNARFLENLRIFEFGKIFAYGRPTQEKLSIGFCIAGKGNSNALLELKGAIGELLREFGMTDVVFVPKAESVRIILDGRELGYLRTMRLPGAKGYIAAVGELDAGALSESLTEERAFKPLSKFPDIIRDISLVVSKEARIGDIVEDISLANPEIIGDVDLADEYTDEKMGDKQSLTFRIVFQAKDRTLSDDEVNAEVERIIGLLRKKFEIEIR
jgi:phenylalanyl-tRNA synthetase beta chain